MSAIVQAEPYENGGEGGELTRPGRGDLGMISIADQVVTKIAACEIGRASCRERVLRLV